ncbi:DNA/RNA non-specific endonuclease [Lactococcus allomyrinae]|uniref:DNA/RNA non-specific endonuclease n=1 Tax=Lactococcus allomyrinae TaxID=2419773 RepID=A0A387BBP4_9LACT|nr:DNA/RNA non-specific endonuclease [Lactococcus allomyrinae]AYF99837.1 DNA/RNA non-specific endonuclease [Lactococcus allomyrinae]
MAKKGGNSNRGCGATIGAILFLLVLFFSLAFVAVRVANAHGFDVLGTLKNAGTWIWKNSDTKGIDDVKFSAPNTSSIKSAVDKGKTVAGNVASNANTALDKANPNTQSSATTTQGNVDYGKTMDKQPTESLAESVLTSDVRKQLGNTVTYDGHGSFYVNSDKSTLSSPTGQPFLKSGTLSANGQLSASTAILSHSMSAKRVTTEINWEPAGYKQLKINAPAYGNYLYNKGHSLGAALSSGWSGESVSFSMPIYATQKGQWNASEYYADNVTTQTAWANQAIEGQYGTSGYGQNYFEDIVRKEQVSHKSALISYSVKPIYDGKNEVPSGTQIQAKSSDNIVNINVFIPNVEPGVMIDYSTGNAKIAS